MGKAYTMRSCLKGMFLVVSLCLLSAPAGADVIQGTISATGTAEVAGVWDGYTWYKYTYVVEWSDLDHGLSHLDLLQIAGCAESDHLFVFDPLGCEPYDGMSTGEDSEEGPPPDYTVFYDGMLLRSGGDPSLDPEQSPPGLPVIKYEPQSDGEDEPGKSGIGVFWFYANILPTTGTLADYVLAKHDGMVAVGDLTGAYPMCTVTPEPATMGLLGLGVLGLMLRRRK